MPEQTLAQRVRAKHPDAYNDLSDQQLEDAVLKKYPGVYDDLPRTTQAAPPAPAPAAAPPATSNGRPEEGLASALLPAGLATGASMLVGKTPGLSAAVAGVAGAAGEGMRRIGRLAQDPVPEGPGLAAFKRLGSEALEIPGAMLREGAVQAGAEAVGGAVTKGAQQLGTAVYRGYLKPSLSMVDLPKAREIVATGIREMLPIAKAGEERAGKLIRQLNDQVTSILSSTKGGKVDLHDVAERVRTFARKKFDKPGVDPSDLNAAMEVADRLDAHPSLGLPKGAKATRIDVTPTQANEVKQAVRPNSRAYGQQGATSEAAARKAAGHELRSDLEKVAPEIAGLNDRERKLIDALDAVKHAAGREENRSALFGVPTLVAGAYGTKEMATGDDAATATMKALVMRGALSPAVASRAAILAAKFASVPGTGAALATRMGAILALRESEDESK